MSECLQMIGWRCVSFGNPTLKAGIYIYFTHRKPRVRVLDDQNYPAGLKNRECFTTFPNKTFSFFFDISEMKTQQPLHVATPVRQSLALTKVAGTSIYLKLDSSQPTGSFKIRGIGHLCKTVSNLQFMMITRSRCKGTSMYLFR